MSSVLGHGLAGLAVYKGLEDPARLPRGWKGALLAVGLGAAPDLDVLALIAFPGAFSHRGATHSLVFAVGLALVSAFLICLRRWPELPRVWLGLTLVCAVHPLLDYLMGCGPAVPLLWPFYDQGFLSPVQVVPTAYYSRSLHGLAALLLHRPTLVGLGLEALIFVPLVCLAGLGRRIKGGLNRAAFALVMLAVSSAGLFLNAAR